MQKDMNHIFQTFVQASKDRSKNKFKAKNPDVYRNRSHIKCYNFYQQCEDYFATYKASGPNQIPFAAFFL